MRVIVAGTLALLAWAAPAPALDEPAKGPEKDRSVRRQYDALVQQYAKEQQDFFKEYAKARTDAERQKLFQDKYPNAQKYADQFLALAEKAPRDPVAVDAYIWIVQNARSGPAANKALSRLVTDHLDSPRIGDVCFYIQHSGLPDTEQTLRQIMDKSPQRGAQGLACLNLAQYLARRRPQEAEKLFERVAEKYGDVKTSRATLADAAKAELFELRNLAIGKPAPEIEGEDLDGKKFKLSDYKGKVVVLDFWGHW
jgi:hypothetical protein